MADFLCEGGNLVATDLVPQGSDSFLKLWQRDVRVRLSCFCTDRLQTVAGQHKVSQADQMQVSTDSLPRLHVVIAQPKFAAQFLEQHFDVPSLFVNLNDVAIAPRQFIGRDCQHFGPGISGTIRKHDANVIDLRKSAVRRRDSHPSPATITFQSDAVPGVLQNARCQRFERTCQWAR